MRRMTKYGGALLAGVLAITGCSGSTGNAGAPGTNGTDGTDGTNGINGTNGTNGVNGVTGKLSLTIDSVVTAGGTSTLTFTIRPAAAVCPGGVCDPTLSNKVIGQKTFYAQQYNAGTNTFDTAQNFSFGSIAFVGISADGNGAQYTAKKTNAPFAPETAAGGYVYAYVTGLSAVPAPTSGHYYLPTSVASAAKAYGTVNYTSVANVSGCESCHGAPYSKHGYRQARILDPVTHQPVIPDFAACKTCHTDQRVGSDGQWFVRVDDPATLALDPEAWDTTKYAYTANIMNDVHNSHAMEFNYPQSMSNCVTCHAGKLNLILTDANFKPTTCKSCHPVNGIGGTEEGRAPSLASLWSGSSTHNTLLAGLYTNTSATACNTCHKDGGIAPTFAQLHSGYNTSIYADGNGTRYADTRKAQVDGASFDAAAYVATVSFSVTGVSSTAVVYPTMVASLYGYDSKDFLVSGHSSTPKIECTGVDAACTANLKITAGAAANSFVATIDLSPWASQIAAKQVKRMEVAVLPSIGIDPTVLSTSITSPNPMAGVTGATQTIDLSQTSADARITFTTGKNIVDPAKCNACHDELGITFHNPNYGSAGTVACRVCHSVLNASSHLEMQSRSIDSFVHAIHAMQVLDTKNVNFNNSVAALRYGGHVEGNYPNFAGPLNCESCHVSGTYNVPDQSKSLPSLVSALSSPAGRTGLGTFGQEITGPAARACGGCHRAFYINEADGSSLAALVGHMNDFGSNVDPTLSVTTTAAYIEGLVGGGPAGAPAVAGAQVERCEMCHPTAGSDHQNLFNTWKNGL